MQATDYQLLGNFVSDRDESAFSTLVRRHGAMVRGVCRRILRDPAGTDDAFQATFICLARHSQSLMQAEQPSGTVGSWLYRVAVNAALQIKRKAKSQRRSETAFAEKREDEARQQAAREEWLPILDEEIGSLPDRYQSPLVLCHLQGRTQQDAADELGLTYATVRRRLKRAKVLLKERLTRRGLNEYAMALTAALAKAAEYALAPSPASVGKAVTGGMAAAAKTSVPASVAAASEGGVGLGAALITKNTIAATLTAVGCLSAGLLALNGMWLGASDDLISMPNSARMSQPETFPASTPRFERRLPHDESNAEPRPGDELLAEAEALDLNDLPDITVPLARPGAERVDELIASRNDVQLPGDIEAKLEDHLTAAQQAAAQPAGVKAPAANAVAAREKTDPVARVMQVLQDRKDEIRRGTEVTPVSTVVGVNSPARKIAFKGSITFGGKVHKFENHDEAEPLVESLRDAAANDPAALKDFVAVIQVKGRLRSFADPKQDVPRVIRLLQVNIDSHKRAKIAAGRKPAGTHNPFVLSVLPGH